MIEALSDRDLLIALGGLVLFIVIVDGLRRMRIANRSKIKISKSVHKEVPLRHDDNYNPELPNGGARIIRDMQDLEASLETQHVEPVDEPHNDWQDDVVSSPVIAETFEPEPEPEPEPKPVADNAADDALTDYSVGESFWDEPQAPVNIYQDEPAQEPTTEPDVAIVVESETVQQSMANEAGQDVIEEPQGATGQAPRETQSPPKFVAKDEQLSFAIDDPDQWDLESFSAEARYDNALDDVDPVVENKPAPKANKVNKPTKTKQKKDSTSDLAGGLFTKIKELFAVEDESVKQHDLLAEPSQVEPYKGPTEVLVIHVMAKQGGKLYGDDLLQAFLANGMRFGDKNIFHRLPESDASTPIFSCANAINPGIFNLKTIEQISTPGVSFFVALPNPEDSMYAFEEMAIAAGNIASRLGAEMQDDTRSAMTKQTLEHYKQKVLDFERRRRMRVV